MNLSKMARDTVYKVNKSSSNGDIVRGDLIFIDSRDGSINSWLGGLVGSFCRFLTTLGSKEDSRSC